MRIKSIKLSFPKKSVLLLCFFACMFIFASFTKEDILKIRKWKTNWNKDKNSKSDNQLQKQTDFSILSGLSNTNSLLEKKSIINDGLQVNPEFITPGNFNANDNNFNNAIEDPTVENSNAFSANEKEGVIGTFSDQEEDRTKDNFFTVTLPKLNKDSRAFLTYELYGLTSHGSVSRSVNHQLSIGGEIIIPSAAWSMQKEELGHSVLKEGLNTILFTTPISGIKYKVRNLKIIFEKNKKDIQDYQISTVVSGDYLYVKGISKDNDIRINNSGILWNNGEFEKIIKLSSEEKASGNFSISYHGHEQHIKLPSEEKSFKVTANNVYHYKTVDINKSTETDFNYEGLNIKIQKETAESALLEIIKLREKDIPSVSGGIKNVTLHNSGYRISVKSGKLDKKVKITIPYDDKKLGQIIPKEIKIFSFDYSKKQWKMEHGTVVDQKNKTVTFEGDGDGDYINGIISVPESPQLNAANTTGISGLKAGDPTAAVSMIAPPSANQKGDANVSHPIVIPSGRRGMQPNLSIGYNSKRGNGWMGEGWDISGLSAITIDTRWGSPKFHPQDETELYALDGEMLVYDGNYLPHRHNDISETSTVFTTNKQKRDNLLVNNKKTFYFRRNHNFTKIERYGANPKEYRWIVTSTNGTKTYYGGDENGVNSEAVIKDASQNILQWGILKIVDVYGNNIKYQYDNYPIINQTGENANLNNGVYFHVKKILYTGKDDSDGNYSINFERDNTISRPDISINAKLGKKIVEPFRLNNIVIKYNDDIIRTYNLEYGLGEFFKTVLLDIIEYDGEGEFSNQHRFDYYNDLKENQNSPTINFGNDISIDGGGGSDAFPILPSALKPSKISANNTFEWGVSGRAPGVGLDFLLPNPTNGYGHVMASFNIGHSEAEAKKAQELMDFDGDGIPDLIFRRPSSGLYVRPGNFNSGNITFGSERKIQHLNSNFSLTKTRTNNIGYDAGIKVFNIGFNFAQIWSTSKSDTSSFILDANSDGIMDVVKDGQVLFGRLNHSTGNVEMTQYSDSTENMVIVADALTQHTSPLEGAWQDVIKNDVIKMWVAPKDGFIEFSDVVSVENVNNAKAVYSVEILNPSDPTKNVRIYLKNLQAGMSPQNIVINRYNTYFNDIQALSPPNANNHLAINDGNYLKVKAGEKVFVRLHKNENYSFKVFSDPKITYVNTDIPSSALPYYEQESFKLNNGNYSNNFLLNNHYKPIQITNPGTVSITVPSVYFPRSTDKITFKIIKVNVNSGTETVLYNNVYPQSNTPFNTVPLSSNIANVTNLTFNQNDTPAVLRFVVETDSHMSFKDSNWNRITVNYSPSGGASEFIVAAAEYPSFYITEFNKQIQANEHITGPPPTGTQEYKVELNKSTFTNAGLTKGSFYYIIKRDGQVLAKRRVINPINSVNLIELNMDNNQVINGINPITFYTGDLSTAGVNDGRITVQIYCKSESDYNFYKEYSNLYQNKPFNIYRGPSNLLLTTVNHTSINSASLENVSQFYNNWGQFLYNEYADVVPVSNSDGFALNPNTPADEYGRLINLSSLAGINNPTNLNFPACNNLSTTDETAQCIAQQLSNTGFYQNPVNFTPQPIKPLNTDIITRRTTGPSGEMQVGYLEKWMGIGPEQYSMADSFKDDESATGFFNPQTANPEPPDSFTIQGNVDTKMFGINKKYYSKSRTNTLSGSLFGFGLQNASSVLVGDGSVTLQDFMDMNGDGYPDAVYKDAMQVSNSTGGHEAIQGPFVNAFISNTNSYSNTLSPTYSPEKSIQTGVATRNGEVRSVPSTAWYMPSVGMGSGIDTSSPWSGQVSANYDSKDTGESFWLDINGDGMADRITGGGTSSMKFYLNLGKGIDGGYEYKNAETYSSGPVGSVGLGYAFNLSGITSLPVSVSASASYALGSSKTTFEDINADGLIDILIVGSNQTMVKYNLGNKFSDPVTLSKNSSGVDYNNESKIYRGGISVGGGYYYTVPIVWWPFPPIPLIYLKIGGQATGHVGLSIAEVDKAFKDMNGDGYADLVVSNNDGFTVNYSKIGRTNKLKSVTRTAGILKDHHPFNKFFLDYQFNKPTYNDPNGRLVLSEVKMINPDAMSGNYLVSDPAKDMVTRFRYENSNHDRRERDYFGFEKVTIEEMEGNSIFRSVVQTFYNDSYFLNGLLIRTQTFGNGVNLLSQATNSYSLHKFSNNNTQINLSAIPLTFDTGGTEGRKMAIALLDSTTNTTYENGGNITKSTKLTYNNKGQIRNYQYTSPSSLYNSEISYHNINNNILNVPSEITVYIGTTTAAILRNRTTQVDPNTGDVTQISVQLNASEYAVTNIKYNPYGNISQIEYPVNENNESYSITYEYDATLNKYVTRTRDSFDIESFANYDPKFDAITESIDTGGNTTKYTYDAKGRIISILAPYEDGVNPYTVQYEYFVTHPPTPSTVGAAAYGAVTQNFDPQDPNNPVETISISDGLGRNIQVKKDIDIAGVEKMSVSGMAEYDIHGRVKKQYHPIIEDKDPITSVAPNQILNLTFSPYFTSSVYDVSDRIIQTTDEDGHVGTVSYAIDNSNFKTTAIQMQNAAVQLKSETFNNAEGKVTKSINFLNGQALETKFYYSSIGELGAVMDPQGMVTAYSFDLAGRRISEYHPDHGSSTYEYDPAGNLIKLYTANLQNDPNQPFIKYNYNYNRLTEVRFPDLPNGTNPSNVIYEYAGPGSGNNTGRIIYKKDNSTITLFDYGKIGEVIQEDKTVFGYNIPTMKFVTRYNYDSWNRIRRLIYPDGEILYYEYNLGGNLKRIVNDENYEYVKNIEYDNYEQRTLMEYGNDTKSEYTYLPTSRNLSTHILEDNLNNQLLNNNYTYDFVGNVIQQVNTAGFSPNNMGGYYEQAYAYDQLNRLTFSNGAFSGYTHSSYATDNADYETNLDYNHSGGIVSKQQQHSQNGSTNATNSYKNDYYYIPGTHKIEYIEETAYGNGTEYFEYDNNGNLINNITPNGIIQMFWDEMDRLKAYHSEMGVFQYYTYDDTGERVIKYDLQQAADLYQNGSLVYGEMIMNDYKVYPNPYVVTNSSNIYTKHYYAGSQRVASRLLEGTEKFIDQSRASNKENKKETPDTRNDFQHYLKKAGIDPEKIETEFAKGPGGEPNIYYFHGDHLGSATYVTERHGETTQFFLNLPFGETMAEQMTGVYDNPYKFNAKELDAETGLYYYGARYYNPRLSVWYGVDPLAEKYPNWSPYNYTLNNPINLIDPDGRSVWPRRNGAYNGESYSDRDGSWTWNEQYGRWDGVNGSQNVMLIERGTEVCCNLENTRVMTYEEASIKSQTGFQGPEPGGGSLESVSLLSVPYMLLEAGITEGLMQLGMEGNDAYNTAQIATFLYSMKSPKGVSTKMGVVNKSSEVTEGLLKAANVADKGGLTAVGRALQKHGSRVGSVFPKATGNAASMNAQGNNVLTEILTHPQVSFTARHHARFGNVVEYKIPGGQGARFSGDGQKFIGFIEH